MKQSTRPTAKRTGDDSRRDILAAAYDVFAGRGYAGAAMRDVANRAGISVGGIYIYFPTKEELYLALLRSEMEDFNLYIGRVADMEPAQALKALIDSYLDYAVRKTKLVSLHLKEHDLEIRKPLKELFLSSQHRIIRGILQDGMDSGVFRKMEIDRAAPVVFSCVRGLVLSYLSEGQGAGTQSEMLYEILLNGIMEKTG
ncbi:MAG: TetR/AcrR family transcriptional regulator [Nitrospirae bacterium]|nr:TetR/AcrR family transcriptional regulator [Nitrospirota bacterium]